jgi:hypothetical protein
MVSKLAYAVCQCVSGITLFPDDANVFSLLFPLRAGWRGRVFVVWGK